MRVAASLREERVWAPLFILTLGLVFRLAHIIALRQNPYFVHPVVDARTYHEAALALSRGHPHPDAAFWQPPGYPYFLALVYLVSGPGFFAPRLVQAVLGSLTAVVTYAIGRRVLGRAVGLGAGIAVAAYGMLIYYDGELLTPSLGILLQMAAVLLAVRARVEAGRVAWFGAGLYGGWQRSSRLPPSS